MLTATSRSLPIITVGNRHHNAKGEYVGRGTPLGNPTHVSATCSRDMAIAEFENDLAEQMLDPLSPMMLEMVRLLKLAQDQGHLTLVCSCSPLSCHADIIKRTLQYILRERSPYR